MKEVILLGVGISKDGTVMCDDCLRKLHKITVLFERKRAENENVSVRFMQ